MPAPSGVQTKRWQCGRRGATRASQPPEQQPAPTLPHAGRRDANPTQYTCRNPDDATLPDLQHACTGRAAKIQVQILYTRHTRHMRPPAPAPLPRGSTSRL